MESHKNLEGLLGQSAASSARSEVAVIRSLLWKPAVRLLLQAAAAVSDRSQTWTPYISF